MKTTIKTKLKNEKIKDAANPYHEVSYVGHKSQSQPQGHVKKGDIASKMAISCNLSDVNMNAIGSFWGTKIPHSPKCNTIIYKLREY